jgi:hypothetical protein
MAIPTLPRQDFWYGWSDFVAERSLYNELMLELQTKFVSNGSICDFDDEDRNDDQQFQNRKGPNQRKRNFLKTEKLQRHARVNDSTSQDGSLLAERFRKSTIQKLPKKPQRRSFRQRSISVRDECQYWNQLAKSGQLEDELFPQNDDVE